MATSDFTADELEALRLDARGLRESLLAKNTRRGYFYDVCAYRDWCRARNLQPFSASSEALSLYVLARLRAGKKTSTIGRNVGAILQAHRKYGYPVPPIEGIRDLLRAARRLRTETLRQVEPLSLDDVKAILAALARRETLRAARDAAIILIAFASACRSAEIVALTTDAVEFVEQGIILTLRRSKTDQEGKGRLIGIPRGQHPETCPVAVLTAYLARRGPSPGDWPLFQRVDGKDRAAGLQPEQIGLILKKCVELIGRQGHYSSHSARSGFITECGLQGVPELVIAATSGHSDMRVLRGYFRKRDLWKANASGRLGL